jgi:hypothetical protein
MSFSERYGHKPVRSALQKEDMDLALRTSLWNVVDITFLAEHRGDFVRADNRGLLVAIWSGYFKGAIDQIPDLWNPAIGAIRGYFFGAAWNEVYDFVEFLASRDVAKRPKFIDLCNTFMEREMAAYRFVGGKVTEITSEAEISEIETALNTATGRGGAATHLSAALGLMTDRTSPDYRNSIKESISAVEAVVNEIAGTSGVSLGKALKTLKVQHGIDVHPALEQALSKMYGYTSDAQGIRHALMDEPDLAFEDAKFMLVSCSAFVNYLVAKASSAPVAATA